MASVLIILPANPFLLEIVSIFGDRHPALQQPLIVPLLSNGDNKPNCSTQIQRHICIHIWWKYHWFSYAW